MGRFAIAYWRMRSIEHVVIAYGLDAVQWWACDRPRPGNFAYSWGVAETGPEW